MPRRIALTVGINDYPGTDADLAGCVNDALDWAHVLGDWGYDTHTLLDAHATKANVLGTLRGLAQSARWGDRIVFTYSGHGSWVPDRSGDEADGRDEVLCMHDFRSGGLLTDDELHDVYQLMAYGVRFIILSDSCHSGTVSRFAPQHPPVDREARFLSPAYFLPPAELRRAYAVERQVTRSAARPGSILMSGCADHEYSYDAWFGSRANGAFTRTAIAALPSAGTRISYKAWHDRIRRTLPSGNYPQTPQLSAQLWQRYTPVF